MLRNLALAGLLAVAATGAAQAQVTSTVQTVTINAVKPPTLTVAITGGATQNLTLVDNGVSTGAAPIGITTSWDLNPGQIGAVSLVGYFLSTTAALTDGTNNIPSSRMEGRMTTGSPTAFTAFTQNAVGSVGTAGASLLLFSTTITGANKTASRSDNLDVQVNLGGTTVIPSTYAGTLRIQAIAQ